MTPLCVVAGTAFSLRIVSANLVFFARNSRAQARRKNAADK